jgi:hypothetical protein
LPPTTPGRALTMYFSMFIYISSSITKRLQLLATYLG